MFRFRRNTHDREGNYRKDDMVGFVVDKVMRSAACCIHMLDSEKWLSIDEIVEEHVKYDRAFPDEPYNFPPEEILAGLALLVRYGIVEMKDRHEG